MRLLVAASLVFAWSCSTAEPLPDTCAGHVELCDRRFDQVAFAATHNAMADTDHQIVAACQTHDVATQLEDGIRGFMLDVYVDSGVISPGLVLTCHALCFDNNYPLADVLTTMVRYLRAHRDAILTIVFESYVPADAVAEVFEATNAVDYTYAHVRGEPWPTLREMIERNERLVVLTDSGGGDETGPYPWLMDQWQYAFQNPYAAETEADFACTEDRGTNGPNTLFVMNHFLTAPLASYDLAAMVNPYASLSSHVSTCTNDLGRIPNLITVDFYDVGDLLHVVDEVNGFVSGPPP